MAALGIGFGLVTESDAIMLDGFFSLIGFVMALVTIRVARLVVQPADEHFQFGYAQFEPFLNAMKGLLMLGVAGCPSPGRSTRSSMVGVTSSPVSPLYTPSSP